MKKQLLFSLFLSLSVVLFGAGFAGCGGGNNSSSTGTEQSGEGAIDTDTDEEASLKTVEEPGSGWGTISGRVVLDGRKPRPEKYRISGTHQKSCGLSSTLTPERIEVNSENNGVKDVIVVVDGVKKALKSELAPEEVVIDQKGCRFQPRDTFVVRAGGRVKVKNSDPTSHNFNYTSISPMGPSGNENQSEGGDPVFVDVDGNHFVNFKCNMHPWMDGLLRSQDHHAVGRTDERGEFSFQVPPGSYTLLLRHVKMGETKEVDVSLEEGGSVEEEIPVSFR